LAAGEIFLRNRQDVKSRVYYVCWIPVVAIVLLGALRLLRLIVLRDEVLTSPNGEHVACWDGHEGLFSDKVRYRALVDGNPVGPKIDDPGDIKFSPDSRFLAFAGTRSR